MEAFIGHNMDPSEDREKDTKEIEFIIPHTRALCYDFDLHNRYNNTSWV